MRTVVETGRKISPVIDSSLTDIDSNISDLGKILEDLLAVKTESGRAAILGQCMSEWTHLSELFAALVGSWGQFRDTLGSYRYQFDSRRKGRPHDMPGQQIMDFAST